VKEKTVLPVQHPLPKLELLRLGLRESPVRRTRIPHRSLLNALCESTSGGKSLVDIYREEVLPVKSRTIHLLGRKSTVRIQETLLGYEIKASYKRIHCPDLATARYLKLFSEVGCRSIHLPYDPTVTEALLPRLEAAWSEILTGIRQLFPRDPALQAYVTRKICRHLREELSAR